MRYFTSAFINANDKVLKSINLTALEKDFFNFFFKDEKWKWFRLSNNKKDKINTIFDHKISTSCLN